MNRRFFPSPTLRTEILPGRTSPTTTCSRRRSSRASSSGLGSRSVSARSRTRAGAATVVFPWYSTVVSRAEAGVMVLGVLATAYPAYPERFPAGLPHPPALPRGSVDHPPEALVTVSASRRLQPATSRHAEMPAFTWSLGAGRGMLVDGTSEPHRGDGTPGGPEAVAVGTSRAPLKP